MIFFLSVFTTVMRCGGGGAVAGGTTVIAAVWSLVALHLVIFFMFVEGGGCGDGSQGTGVSREPYMYLQASPARCGEGGGGGCDNIVTGKILLRRSMEDTRGSGASQRGSVFWTTFIIGAEQEVGRVDTIMLHSPR